jgi:transketolase
VQDVDWTRGAGQSAPSEYVEDVQALYDAILEARAVRDRPSLINLRTIIAWPAPNAQNTGKAHGSALGEDEVSATKKILGFDPGKTFEVSDDVLDHTRELLDRGKAAQDEWSTTFEAWARANPERKALFDRMLERRLPEGWDGELPTFDADPKGVATRKASGEVVNAIAARLPELWGGSADLAESNNTTPKGEPSFIPAEHSTREWSGDPYGRVLHFGIREHAMGALMNGIAQHGGTRVYGGTFLVFSDYMRPAVRLAAIQGLPVVYVWTHDSVGLGEDGPTHQPVEHLAALRAIPGLDVVRPADANETVAAWRAVLANNHRPAGLCLTRQNVPVFPRGSDGFGSIEEMQRGVARGGYVLLDTAGQPDVVLVGTGSEVQLAVEARAKLEAEGIAARVVSMPCREWFDAQDQAYRDSVVPPTVRARVSVEAAVAQGWREVVGDHGRSVSLEHFGASADYARIYKEFGITTDAVVQAAKDSIGAATA